MTCKVAPCLSELNGALGISKLVASRSQKSLGHLIQGCLLTIVSLIILSLDETPLLIIAALVAVFSLMATRSKGGFRKRLPVGSLGSLSGQTKVGAGAGAERHPLRPLRSVPPQLAKTSPATADETVPPRRVASQPAMPRQPLKFQATGFEAEVLELVAQISRKPEGEQIAEQIVALVSEALRSSIQVAVVLSYVGGNCLIPSEFATVCPQIHVAMYIDIWASRRPTCVKKVQKALIKSCTDSMTKAGFKFRRSAYGTDDPLVSLLTPPVPACGDQSIFIDFSVNSATPLYLHKLVSICGSLDHRAESMILLVRRWAQDRGIAHATAGHLSDYAWALLTVFFLQVAPGSDVVLPPITWESEIEAPQTAPAEAEGSALKSTAELLQEFFAFYAKDFDWENEAVSVRLAQRGGKQIPVHSVMDEVKNQAAPTIEDPFDPTKMLSIEKKSCIGSLHEELGRAYELCARKASLSELLEPWTED
eukprot:CAMPEP_0170588874 /NCGR_PEP_ID=MMETSP0224-20130122/11062_1 /TAXON_ID=285029 /ORGANISM="Togula jolla, Strain CCCM 725" /LENGTH=478 /DNA_ID=CAMNT_0010912619 /DNA_START=90 /DNA_END=1526 /DNA_ORIENTATION=+